MSSNAMSTRYEGDAPNRYSWIFTLATLLIVSLLGLFAADRLYQPEQFQINSIEVSGKFKHVNGDQIKTVVEKAIDGNYFSVSLERLEKQIANLPWVFSVSLRRRWPSTLLVDVVEIEPVALWGEDLWLNFTGDLVPKQRSGITTLPRISGPVSQQREVWQTFQQWSDVLAQNGLRLEQLELDNRGLWYLDLTLGALAQERLLNVRAEQINDTETAFSGEISDVPDALEQPTEGPHLVKMVVNGDDAAGKLIRFVQAFNQELVIDFANMQSVDLRYPNGFAVGWSGQRNRDHVTETYQ